MQVCHYCLLGQTTLLEDHSMKLWNWAFEWVVSNTGAFLRTILSPTVFTFYYEFRYNLESTTDDSAIFWCMEGKEGEYRILPDRFFISGVERTVCRLMWQRPRGWWWISEKRGLLLILSAFFWDIVALYKHLSVTWPYYNGPPGRSTARAITNPTLGVWMNKYKTIKTPCTVFHPPDPGPLFDCHE